MTYRTLTAIALRLTGLFLFMRIFDYFGSYFLSVYYALVIPFFEKQTRPAAISFYYNGTFLIVINIVVSCLLVFKADWISAKLIKQDKDINIGLTPVNLVKVILLTNALLWLASSVYLLPTVCQYIYEIIEKHGNIKIEKTVDFSPGLYILKTIIAILFIVKIDKIVAYLERNINKNVPVKNSGEDTE